MHSWGERLWTELPGLRKADRAPGDPTGWALVDGGCGVPMLSVADIAMDRVEKIASPWQWWYKKHFKTNMF
jgi:hypothetical protein